MICCPFLLDGSFWPFARCPAAGQPAQALHRPCKPGACPGALTFWPLAGPLGPGTRQGGRASGGCREAGLAHISLLTCIFFTGLVGAMEGIALGSESNKPGTCLGRGSRRSGPCVRAQAERIPLNAHACMGDPRTRLHVLAWRSCTRQTMTQSWRSMRRWRLRRTGRTMMQGRGTRTRAAVGTRLAPTRSG